MMKYSKVSDGRADQDIGMDSSYDTCCQFDYCPEENDSYQVCMPLSAITAMYCTRQKVESKIHDVNLNSTKSKSYLQGSDESQSAEDRYLKALYWKGKRHLIQVPFKRHHSFDSRVPEQLRTIPEHQLTELAANSEMRLQKNVCCPFQDRITGTAIVSGNSLYEHRDSSSQHKMAENSADVSSKTASRNIQTTKPRLTKQMSLGDSLCVGRLKSVQDEGGPASWLGGIRHRTRGLDHEVQVAEDGRESSRQSQVSAFGVDGIVGGADDFDTAEPGCGCRPTDVTELSESETDDNASELSDLQTSGTCLKYEALAWPISSGDNLENGKVFLDLESVSDLMLQEGKEDTAVDAKSRTTSGAHINGQELAAPVESSNPEVVASDTNQKKKLIETRKSLSLESNINLPVAKNNKPMLYRSHSTDRNRHHILPQSVTSLLVEGNYRIMDDDQLSPTDQTNFRLRTFQPQDVSQSSRLPTELHGKVTLFPRRSSCDDIERFASRELPRQDVLVMRRNSNSMILPCFPEMSNTLQSEKTSLTDVKDSPSPPFKVKSSHGDNGEAMTLKRLLSSSDLNGQAKKKLETMVERERIRRQSLSLGNIDNTVTTGDEQNFAFVPSMGEEMLSASCGLQTEALSDEMSKLLLAKDCMHKSPPPLRKKPDETYTLKVSALVKAFYRSLSVDNAIGIWGECVSEGRRNKQATLVRSNSEQSPQHDSLEVESNNYVPPPHEFEIFTENCSPHTKGVAGVMARGKRTSNLDQKGQKKTRVSGMQISDVQASETTHDGLGINTWNFASFSSTIVIMKSWRRKLLKDKQTRLENKACISQPNNNFPHPSADLETLESPDNSQRLLSICDQYAASTKEITAVCPIGPMDVPMSAAVLEKRWESTHESRQEEVRVCKPHSKAKASVYTVWRTYRIIQKWTARTHKSIEMTHTKTVCETRTETHSVHPIESCQEWLPVCHANTLAIQESTGMAETSDLRNKMLKVLPQENTNKDINASNWTSALDILGQPYKDPDHDRHGKNYLRETSQKNDKTLETFDTRTATHFENVRNRSGCLHHTDQDGSSSPLIEASGVTKEIRSEMTHSDHVNDGPSYDRARHISSQGSLNGKWRGRSDATASGQSSVPSDEAMDDHKTGSRQSSQVSSLSKTMVDASSVEDDVFFGLLSPLISPDSSNTENLAAIISQQKDTAHNNDREGVAIEIYGSPEVHCLDFDKFKAPKSKVECKAFFPEERQSVGMESSQTFMSPEDKDIFASYDKKKTDDDKSSDIYEWWHEKGTGLRSELCTADEVDGEETQATDTVIFSDRRDLLCLQDNIKEPFQYLHGKDKQIKGSSYDFRQKDVRKPSDSFLIEGHDSLWEKDGMEHSFPYQQSSDSERHDKNMPLDLQLTGYTESEDNTKALEATAGLLHPLDSLEVLSEASNASSSTILLQGDDFPQDNVTLQTPICVKPRRSPSLLAMCSSDSLLSRTSKRRSVKRDAEYKRPGSRPSWLQNFNIGEEGDGSGDAEWAPEFKRGHDKLKAMESNSSADSRARSMELKDFLDSSSFGHECGAMTPTGLMTSSPSRGACQSRGCSLGIRPCHNVTHPGQRNARTEI